MFFVVFLMFLGIFRCDGQYNYQAEQGNVTWDVQPENDYIDIGDLGDETPTEIEYLDNINSTTGLMVRVVFGDEDGPLDAKNAEDTRMNICDILDRAIDDPTSSQARYNMPKSLGLDSNRCPIEKGVRTLSPYNFPTEFTTKDLGCGDRYYEMRVETVDQDLGSRAILKLRVHLKLGKNNETCDESSSSISLMPSIVGCLALIVLVSAY